MVERVQFSLARLLRLSTFQVGSAMGEILTASVWNRVMIKELGMPATPVALLLALQYLLVPVSLWAGHRSDALPLWRFRRTSYIWLGRFLVLLSFPMLGMTLSFFEDGRSVEGWSIAAVCFLLFGAGKLMSGSVYLALVRESVPPQKQGIAIASVETALIALFVVTGVAFGRWMEVYSLPTFWQMVGGTVALAGLAWFAAIVGMERRLTPVEARSLVRPDAREPLRETFRHIWADGRARAFFAFLSISTMTAWMQDVILEPLGGEVFGLEAGVTSQFVRYWGGTTIVTLLIGFLALRHRRPMEMTRLAAVGLTLMALGIGGSAVASMMQNLALLYTGLLVYGAGFGLYTFGGLSLMAVMSPSRDAGAYLALWTISVLVFKGLGTFAGGFGRDIFLFAGFGAPNAYGITLLFSAVGLLLSVVLLRRVDVVGFARDAGRFG